MKMKINLGHVDSNGLKSSHHGWPQCRTHTDQLLRKATTAVYLCTCAFLHLCICVFVFATNTHTDQLIGKVATADWFWQKIAITEEKWRFPLCYHMPLIWTKVDNCWRNVCGSQEDFANWMGSDRPCCKNVSCWKWIQNDEDTSRQI